MSLVTFYTPSPPKKHQKTTISIAPENVRKFFDCLTFSGGMEMEVFRCFHGGGDKERDSNMKWVGKNKIFPDQ